MRRFVFVVLLIFPNHCFAEVFEYTDSSGVVHFTDDASKVPKAKRKAKASTSLSDQESKVMETLIKLDHGKEQTIPAAELPRSKKILTKFGELYKDELGDPAEKVDSRLSSPEGALALFKKGLEKGNLDDVKKALTGKAWDSGFNILNSQQLAEAAKVYSGMIVTEKEKNANTAVFSIKNTETGMDYTMDFINFYGNWKISKP